TMSAPHSLATRAICLAISRSPLWLTPASAMIVTGMRPSFLWSGLVFQLAAHFFQFFQLAHVHPAVFANGVDADFLAGGAVALDHIGEPDDLAVAHLLHHAGFHHVDA